MRLLAVAILLLAGLAWPLAVAAQESLPPPASTHTRARDGEPTTLTLENARLFVPAGAVTPGAVVAFGTGGVPAPDGSLGRSGVVVSAAGGLHAPVAALIAPTPIDRTALGNATPALRAATDGTLHACASSRQWIVCPVPNPGAYVLDATDASPSTDPLLGAALASVPETAEDGRSGLIVRLLIIAAAAVGGGTIAWLLNRPRTSKREPSSPA